VLENTSAGNRNNTRTDLSSLVQTLVDNEIITDNYIKNINVLKSSPERNKTYSITQETDILKYIELNDPILLLYIQFITYNFLRPVEVNRLKIGDLDLEGKKLFVRAKNKAVKVKIIPQKIIDLLPDLSTMNSGSYLFTPTAIGAQWDAEENNRRDNFSKKFKLVKDHFNLNQDYGLYSFRHTSITNLYREIRKGKTPHESKSILMGITGHQTMEALEKYLRDIDAELPDDYSHLLK
jgi:integrase